MLWCLNSREAFKSDFSFFIVYLEKILEYFIIFFKFCFQGKNFLLIFLYFS